MNGHVRLMTAAVLCLGSPLAAQPAGPWSMGGAATGTLFVGSASDFLDGALGLDLWVARSVAPHVDLRADGMVMWLEAQENPSESADNRMILFGAGPQIHADVGPVTAYARGIVGVAVDRQARTGSVLPERTTSSAAFGGGIGLRVGLGARWSLDVGGDVLKVGDLDFARTEINGPTLIEDPGLLRLRAGLRWGL